uniref:Uncharacterized protein n=1 Tax=Eutreptiella gymnastica TaxID=73025 RepID=A0A7S1NMV1_9EUGL|mmetsp:Transcript_60135/g.107317  ORF Transcript_60135/g.107317 Transcript_60135/m.107317 type:complete len:109 (+) Transcript_60135:109-435(+)
MNKKKFFTKDPFSFATGHRPVSLHSLCSWCYILLNHWSPHPTNLNTSDQIKTDLKPVLLGLGPRVRLFEGMPRLQTGRIQGPARAGPHSVSSFFVRPTGTQTAYPNNC